MRECAVCGSPCYGRYCAVCGPIERNKHRRVETGADKAYLGETGPHLCECCGGLVATRAALATDCPHGSTDADQADADEDSLSIDADTLQERLYQPSSTPDESQPQCPECGSVALSPRGNGPADSTVDAEYRCTNCSTYVDDPELGDCR